MSQNNDHTGARLVSKVPNEKYKENYDKIFNKDKRVSPCQGHGVWVLGENATQVEVSEEVNPNCCGGCC